MSGKALLVFTLLVALLVCSAASISREAKNVNALQQLLTKTLTVNDAAVSQEQTPKAHSARPQRGTHLSEYERETMTKQIMQAISEMMNSDCVLDRDYQGWVDFGRRNAE